MEFSLWILIVIIFFIILLIFLWRLGVFTQEEPVPPDIEKLLEEAREKSSWSKPQDGPNSLRSSCNVYTFPATTPEDPGIPTFDADVLNKLMPVSAVREGCIDPDQLAAKQQKRTCLGNSSSKSGGNTGNICLDSSGKVYQKGQMQILYQPCDVPKCKDQYGVIAINFSPEKFDDSRCLADENGKIVGRPCSLADEDQLWRIQRAAPAVSGEKPIETPSGIYARLFKREKGLCIVPSAEDVNAQLELGSCDSNEGFNWLLAPPVNIIENTSNVELTVSKSDLGLSDAYLFSFIVSGEKFCLIPRYPYTSNIEVEFQKCEESNNQGALWVDSNQGLAPDLNDGNKIKLETEKNSQNIRLRIDNICIVPSSDIFSVSNFKTQSCLGDEGFVWKLTTGVSETQKVTPQQLVYSKKGTNPPDPDNLVHYIQTEDPLSMKLGHDDKIVLDKFSTNNQVKNQTTQIMDYQIYKVIRDTPNTGNTGINFPFYQWI